MPNSLTSSHLVKTSSKAGQLTSFNFSGWKAASIAPFHDESTLRDNPPADFEADFEEQN